MRSAVMIRVDATPPAPSTLGFVLGLANARRNDGRTVMLRHLLIALVDDRREPRRFVHARLEVARQLRFVELNVHPDGRFYPWGEDEIVVVQEGAFI